MCFEFVYNVCLKHFSSWEEINGVLSQIYVSVHAQYPSFLSDFNENLIFSTDFRKH